RRNPCDDRRRARTGDDQPRLPRVPAGDPELQCRCGVGGRYRGGHSPQHRRLLPRPHRRQEPGRLTMARKVPIARKVTWSIFAWAAGFVVFFPILWMVITG